MPPHSSHFGVYAVILNNSKTHLLLIKKSRGPYTGRYDLPGGTMEDGELLDQTLMREVMEETGCMVTRAHQLGAVSTLFPYEKSGGASVLFRHIGVLYQTDIAGTPLIVGDGHDSLGCVWIPWTDITGDGFTPFVFDAVRFIVG
jgi:8-oxo-dGTP diphosphatase